MWFRKAKNLFALDFNHLLDVNITNKILIPNINDELEEFEMSEYTMIQSESHNIRTLHGFNSKNSIVLTMYSTYINAFVFDSESNYSLTIGDDNLYNIKVETDSHKDFKCGTFSKINLRRDKKSNANSDDFSIGEVVRSFRFVFGLSN